MDDVEYRYSSGELKQMLHAGGARLAELDAAAPAPADQWDHWLYLNARKAQLSYLEDVAALLVKAYDNEGDPRSADAAEEVHEHYYSAWRSADRAVEDARAAYSTDR